MDKLSKEKIAALKIRHAKTRMMVLKCGLCFGLFAGCVLGYYARKKLMSEKLCKGEDREFYKARCIDIKNALLEIKAHHKQSKKTS